MINLLPYEHKREILAARTNSVLLKYILILSAALVVLVGLTVAAYIVLFRTEQSAQSRVLENNNEVAQYSSLNKQATEFRANLATAKAILDKQTAYSKLVYRIADAVPSNVILESLSLDQSTIGTETQLNANAKTYGDAIRLKDSFTNKPELFGNVRFSTLTGGPADGATAGYPVKVTLSVTIQKDALK